MSNVVANDSHLQLILEHNLAHINTIQVGRPFPVRGFGALRPRRLLVALFLLMLALWPGELGEITRAMIESAYIQVSVFVAATLLIFYGSERLFGFSISETLKNSRYLQVPLAALLGATPGCGGAVVVVAAYTSGHVGFGAVIATLTATMGDAAFLLIATRPDAAAVVLPLSLIVGIVSGWIVERYFHVPARASRILNMHNISRIGRVRIRDYIYCGFAFVGLVPGICLLLMLEFTENFAYLVSGLSLFGAALGVLIWVISPVRTMTNPKDHPVSRMAEETSFIAIWVIAAYLAYEYLTLFLGIDLEEVFSTIAPFLPLMGILIGLIPGCGPQVLVTTLYINGLIPFAALIGNAISNDGDALFPAIALDPRAAILATAYSTIPALIVAYGFYFLFPSFMN